MFGYGGYGMGYGMGLSTADIQNREQELKGTIGEQAGRVSEAVDTRAELMKQQIEAQANAQIEMMTARIEAQKQQQLAAISQQQGAQIDARQKAFESMSKTQSGLGLGYG